MKNISILLMGALALLISGCSIQANIENLEESAAKLPAGQQTGFVSGSMQNQTVNGYNVSTSVGHYVNGIQQTVNGYTVYVGVQGSISSD